MHKLFSCPPVQNQYVPPAFSPFRRSLTRFLLIAGCLVMLAFSSTLPALAQSRTSHAGAGDTAGNNAEEDLDAVLEYMQDLYLLGLIDGEPLDDEHPLNARYGPLREQPQVYGPFLPEEDHDLEHTPVYEPEIPDEFEYVDPCDPDVRLDFEYDDPCEVAVEGETLTPREAVGQTAYVYVANNFMIKPTHGFRRYFGDYETGLGWAYANRHLGYWAAIAAKRLLAKPNVTRVEFHVTCMEAPDAEFSTTRSIEECLREKASLGMLTQAELDACQVIHRGVGTSRAKIADVLSTKPWSGLIFHGHSSKWGTQYTDTGSLAFQDNLMVDFFPPFSTPTQNPAADLDLVVFANCWSGLGPNRAAWQRAVGVRDSNLFTWRCRAYATYCMPQIKALPWTSPGQNFCLRGVPAELLERTQFPTGGGCDFNFQTQRCSCGG